MEYRSFSSDQNVVVAGDSEQGNTSVTVEVINELREKTDIFYGELEHLKQRETAPTTDSLFQEDLNKIKTGLKVCSNAIRSTNDLFKSSDKKCTEISNEVKALKREVNERFNEEKDVSKSRNELLDFLNKGMAKLQNGTKQLVNEIKNVRDGLKATSNATQSTKDLLRNSDKRITETSDKVQALEKEISKCLSVKAEAFNGGSFVKEEDLVELRNGMFNVYGKGIQQVQARSKQVDNEIKNVREGLKKQQEKVESVLKSTISIKNQCKDTNEKQVLVEKSIKQCSNEIQKLQLELKAEQQKNIILEKKLMKFECHLEEILQRNDIKQIANKETGTRTGAITKSCSQRSDFFIETSKLTMPDLETKKHDQMDMQSKLLTHGFECMDIVSKDDDDVIFNKEAKSKIVCEEINQPVTNKEECRNSLPQKAEAFYEKESSVSSVYSQTDDICKNHCTDFAFDSSTGKEGALSYLEKAHAYLQNLQMAEMFPLSDEESSAVPDDGCSVTCDLENDTKKDCGEEKKKNKQKKREKENIRDRVLNDKIEWMIRSNVRPKTGFTSERSYPSGVFYTGTPGYRLQLHAKINWQKGKIFFFLRVLKGVYDNDLDWPCRQGICIKLSEKMQLTGTEYWFIPEKDVLKRPNSKNDKVHTKWLGPFNLSHYLDCQDLIFDIYLG